MVSYIYFRNDQQDLLNRFLIPEASAEDIRGLTVWTRYIRILISYLNTESESEREEIRASIIRDLKKTSEQTSQEGYEETRSTEELIVTLLLQSLRQMPPLSNPCPRLFISHRQRDWLYALRIAQLASTNGFAYWIDICDPYLIWLNKTTKVPPALTPILTACIIEMAIINCTHVIACMTPQTRGSLWLPYEYGRITKLPGYSQCAGAWRHPHLAHADMPEYMLLGIIMANKNAIIKWLKNELKLVSRPHCGINANDVLDVVSMPELPEEIDIPQDEDYPYELLAFLKRYEIDDAEKERSILKILFGLLLENKKKKQQETEDYINAGMPLQHDIKALRPLRFKRK
jgi:hypothetical protein